MWDHSSGWKFTTVSPQSTGGTRRCDSSLELNSVCISESGDFVHCLWIAPQLFVAVQASVPRGSQLCAEGTDLDGSCRLAVSVDPPLSFSQ